MFRYVYEVAPIDFFDGTISIGKYIDSIISELSWYKDLLLDVPEWYEEDHMDINFCNNMFEDTPMDGKHAFYRLKRIGKEIKCICEYFNIKKEKIDKKRIRVFSVPTDGECTVSYMVKTNNNGTTYIFSNVYFPFLDSGNNVEKI